ncbi:MAG: hypothetical protein HYX26_08395 [Acidobacteriales bacterium]|nr:hypothetical protein [Terriglobales bacterium]
MKRASLSLLLATLLFLLAGCGEKSAAPAASSQKAEKPLMKVDPATAGAVEGVITFKGVPPKPESIDMSQDPACVFGNVTPNRSQAYEVANGKLANVYVYVKEAPLAGARFESPKEAVALDQNGCRYAPHVLALMIGQTLHILNSDPALHNVNAQSKVAPWNVSQSPKGAPIDKVFAQPEVMMVVKCNQHPWMKAYVNVSAHPFFAVTGPDGKFAIRGLPPGEYTLAAVHEKLGEQTTRVSIGAKETKSVGFEFGVK